MNPSRSSQRGPLLVVALGGNAITEPGKPVDIPAQFAQTARTARSLADLIQADYRLLVTHGNGPQVGSVLRRVELAASHMHTLPLEICVADTQAGMGYMITQCLMNELQGRGIRRQATTVVTTVRVDPADPDFGDPSKPIGRTLPREAAMKHQQQDGWLIKEVGNGLFRRVVASPQPLEILESEVIRQLVENGHLIVACGGGGIPVHRREDGTYEGVGAVVDKDLASALLATAVEADALVILTAVDRVYRDFDKPQRQPLDHLTVEQARATLREGQFPRGSMGPKIEAAIQFLENTSKPRAEVLITDGDHVVEALRGRAGTRITRMPQIDQT